MNGLEGTCLTLEDCYHTEGQASRVCGHSIFLYCCVYVHTCGHISKQRVSYFRSPDFPSKSSGSLACDFDLIILPNTGAVRIDYYNVNLARRLGGVCDLDQLFILNSVDGPTSALCGPLSGYSTTVAVKPGQIQPLKLAILIQNGGTYYWDIKIKQLPSAQLRYFKAPPNCGEVRNDIYSTSSSNYLNSFNDAHWLQDIRHWKSQIPQHTWWSYPEPIFNTFYYKTTKRHLLQGIVGGRRIVSGTDAYLGEFPWTVAIGLDNMFFCGGALISEKFVVTAAHCLMTRDTPIGSLIVHLGDHDLTNDNETEHQLRTVSRVLFHSHFHPFLLANDVALLQLNTPVEFTDTIQPICLPEPENSYTGEKGTVVGWGITSFPMGEPSPVLQKLEVETLTNFECSRLIEEPVTVGMMCASPTHKQGTCFGDSGGPLTIQDKTGHHILVGVVSFGVTGCAVRPAFPDLYTRISEYMKWIDVNAL
ncbi:enteropeptidase [Halyomorpha halys]|uniref:enteropeptidase n=1 Tax=Halyomorpha halys TaxID=286706 RepID=UPI0006D50C76|nr:melanization protease 1 isoform X2 [Halyomorpha halys]XP_024215219.1 melanization protease 1 isoform X2 [Halyomorpha halys]